MTPARSPSSAIRVSVRPAANHIAPVTSWPDAIPPAAYPPLAIWVKRGRRSGPLRRVWPPSTPKSWPVTQLAALMGTVWVLHLLSSALKAGTGGLSVLLTGGAQGAVAYYSTYLVGRAAERYFALGKSWGPAGPQAVVEEILESVDRDSILRQARNELRQRLDAARS